MRKHRALSVVLFFGAVFLASCGGSSGSGGDSEPQPGVITSSECFNPILAQQGSTWSAEYRESIIGDSADGEIEDFADYGQKTVIGDATFDGRQAVEIMTTLDGGYTYSDYYQFNFGSTSRSRIGYSSTPYVEIIDAGEEIRFGLEPGESYSFETNDVYYDGDYLEEESTASYVVTYVSRRTIAVPAGTFDTCSYKIELERVGSISGGPTRTINHEIFVDYGVDNGLVIKFRDEYSGYVSGTYSAEMESASINGASL